MPIGMTMVVLDGCAGPCARLSGSRSFPYMVCEAFSCAVPALLDELVTEQSLCALFSLLLPALRPDMQAGRRGRPAPYVLGYWAKVVALLCKRRPAALMRFLSLQVRWCMRGGSRWGLHVV